jgi:hypothetical protein
MKITKAEEKYVHFEECRESLNRAWRILQKLRTTTMEPIIYYAAYSFALVEYAKPYKCSRGIHSTKEDPHPYRRKLPEPLADELALHQKILSLRDQVLAHSDMTLEDANGKKVPRSHVSVARNNGRASIVIWQNYTSEFPEIAAVIQLIEHTLENMKKEKHQLVDALAT